MSALPPDFLLTLTLVSTGSVGLAGLATFLLRRKSAALRHFIWAMSLGAPLLALPIGFTHVRISLPILPPAQASSQTHDFNPEAKVPLQLSTITPTTQSPSSPAPSLSQTASHPFDFALPSNPWLDLWLLGAALISLRVLYTHLKVRHLVRAHCSPASADLISHFNRIKPYSGFRRPIRLMVTPLTEIPFCCGIFRPIIVFPESWPEWDDERIEVCLTHELAHIARGDLSAMALAQAACLACWFNPLVWFAAGRLRDEAENSADDWVLAKNIRPETYASNLLAITEKYRASTLSPTIALSMARPNRLKTRIEAILDPAMPRKAPAWAPLLSIGFLSTLALFTVMLVRLTAAPTPTIPTVQKQDLVNLEPRQRDLIWTTAFRAMQAGDIQVIQSYLDRGLNVNVDLISNSSLLFNAVADQQLAIVNLLLSRGADPNQKTSWGDTPVNRACWLGNKPIADVLIKAGAHPVDLLYAAGMGDVPALEALNKKEPITAKKARWALNFANASGHQNTLDWLWAKLGPMDDKQKDKALDDLYSDAAKWGQLAMLQHLETLGATPAKFGVMALRCAAGGNYPDITKYLLDKGVSPNVSQPHWANMLREAAGEGRLEIVRLLIDHGADMNVRDSQGNTPLNWAAYNGKDDVCLLLLERGADGSIADEWDQNSAWNAAGAIHTPDALEAMIKKGVKITGQNTQGQSIMSYMMRFQPPRPGKIGFPGKIYSAAEIEDYNKREHRVVDLLIAAGADFNGKEGTETPLMTSLIVGHFAAAQSLIEHGADLSIKDKEGNIALIYFFNYSGADHNPMPLDLLEAILKRSPNPNPDFYVAYQPPQAFPLLEKAILFTANQNSDPDSFRGAVKLLLDHGAKFPGADDKVQALLQATARGNLTAVQDSIQQGASINAADGNGWNSLTISTALGYDDISFWLIDHGADLAGHIRGDGYDSPLIFATQHGNTDLVNKLIAKGTKLNPGDAGLASAVQQNNQPLFDALIKAGADPAQLTARITITSGGKSYTPPESIPLFTCIEKGETAMAKTLLEKGVNPEPGNLQDDRNLVYWAVYYNQPDILKALLAHGANPSLKDSRGITPLALAQKSHQDLVPILQDAIKQAGTRKE